MKHFPVKNALVGATAPPVLEYLGSSRDCLRDLLAAQSPAPERFSYALLMGVRSLLRYYREDDFRRHVQAARVVLAAGLPAAWLIQQLSGVRLPIRSAARIADTVLEVCRPSDRVVWVGATPDVRTCVDMIEARSPFRFCVLAVDCAEQITQAVLARQRARGLALCVGPQV